MLKKFKLSAKNLTNVNGLVLAAMLLAVYSVLGTFKIPISLDNRITLTFSAVSAAAMILGPIPAMLVAGLGDIIAFLLNPGGGAYFFGFTVSAMLGGLIYGMCLYKRNSKRMFWWIMLAVFLITLFVNMILNTYWLSIMYGKAYQVFAAARIIKNLIAYPIHIVVIFALHTLIERVGVKKKYL